jgi:GNAT superfamily N-acetyltransferase
MGHVDDVAEAVDPGAVEHPDGAVTTRRATYLEGDQELDGWQANCTACDRDLGSVAEDREGAEALADLHRRKMAPPALPLPPVMPPADPVAELQKRFAGLGVVSHRHFDATGVLHLDTLQVVGPRDQGSGTAFMEAFMALADRRHWTVALTPGTDFGATSVGRLERFYGRFGFTRNRGRHPEISESMVRVPRSGHTVVEVVGPATGYAGGDLYHAFVLEDETPAGRHFAGEAWVLEGRVKLLDTLEGFRRRGVASAIMDRVLADSPDTVYELDGSEPDGLRFLRGYERSRGVRVRRGRVRTVRPIVSGGRGLG